MKAMACPQCGALIKKISPKDIFAFCDYCGARILLPKNKAEFVENSDKTDEKKLTPWEQYRENYGKVQERANRYNAPDSYPQVESKSSLVPIIFLSVVIVPLIIYIASEVGCRSQPTKVQDKTPVKSGNSFVFKPPTPMTFPTPQPSINYEVKVQWNGNYDMEHFENPQIDMSKLPTFNEAELKKTVFKNRSVQVRITIDTTGEVTSAEAISGHPILKEAAEHAAKKNLFNSRQKPTKRVLTYYFRLTNK